MKKTLEERANEILNKGFTENYSFKEELNDETIGFVKCNENEKRFKILNNDIIFALVPHAVISVIRFETMINISQLYKNS